MTAETTRATAEKLAQLCRENRESEGLDTIYHADAISIEAMEGPGHSREYQGLDAIRGKHEWWDGAMEIHSANLEGPFMHGDDRFAMIFEFDATERESGKRFEMKEIGIYTVDDHGKIMREEFYYTM
ncbi:MAG: nuclear transport factor 2 family protein [Pseudomonadota bacterium]